MAVIQVNWKPDERQLRGFGIICLVAFGAIGSWIFFRHSFVRLVWTPETARAIGWTLWSLAGACLLLSLTAPRLLLPLYIGLTAITLPIGFVVSHVIMAVLFYLVITPFGLVFRLIGRDALHRKFDPAAESYWVQREPVGDVKRYLRQF